MASEILPPPRSLLYARPVPPEEGGGFEFGCDCGTVTQVILEGLDENIGSQEIAFTCDGCQSAHWFKVWPAGEAAGGDGS